MDNAQRVAREVCTEPNDVPRDENGIAYEFYEILTTIVRANVRRCALAKNSLDIMLAVIARLKYDLIAK